MVCQQVWRPRCGSTVTARQQAASGDNNLSRSAGRGGGSGGRTRGRLWCRPRLSACATASYCATAPLSFPCCTLNMKAVYLWALVRQLENGGWSWFHTNYALAFDLGCWHSVWDELVRAWGSSSGVEVVLSTGRCAGLQFGGFGRTNVVQCTLLVTRVTSYCGLHPQTQEH